MDTFHLLQLPYPVFKKIIDYTPLGNLIPFIFLNKSIRNMVKLKDYGNVNLNVTYKSNICSINVTCDDGSSTFIQFYQLTKCPEFGHTAVRYEECDFRISKTKQNAMVYTGQKMDEAIMIFIDAIIRLFSSSTFHLTFSNIETCNYSLFL